MTDLLHRKCQALEGGEPMSDTDIRHHLQQVSGWQARGGAIEKTFVFRNYLETISFVNALAWICNAEDHHPELTVTLDRCVARFSTHAVSGVSVNDFICAAKADALISFVG